MKTVLFLAAIILCAPWAQADTATFTGSSGSLAAGATFDFTGNVLTIKLTNTSSVDATVPGAVLSGLFFDLTGNPVLTPVSAIIPAGSSIVQPDTCSTGNCVGATNVGGEFAHNTGIAGRQNGISANGYINLNSGNFGGPNLDDPDAPNGMNFGLVNAGFAAGEGNDGMDANPFINHEVVFTLSGVSGLTAASVSNVLFQYGTSLSQPSFPGSTIPNPPQGQVPEPTSALLLSTIVAGAVLIVKRRRA